MKKLVILGEGQGDVTALPVLIQKLLREKAANTFYVDRDVIRVGGSGLVKWDKTNNKADHSRWISRVALAATRRDVGGILAVLDGDFRTFPPGADLPFCTVTAARSMAAAAKLAGAGKFFSLSVVFAYQEYETWLVAGAESFKGRPLEDGRILLSGNVILPSDDHEARGKGWLEKNCKGYRPTRDQKALTEMLDLECVRSKNLRSFSRLENAMSQLLVAVENEKHISTPN